MTRKTFFLTVLVILLLTSTMTFAKELKIGYIVSEVIREQYDEFKTAQGILDKEKADWEKQYQDSAKVIIDMEKDLKDKEFVYSDTRKAEIRNTIETKKVALAEFEQELTNRLMQRNAELSGPINTKINEILNKIGEQEGYDFIIDANQGNIVYAKDDYDLTNRLLDELKKE
jgi:outer membrane protein